MSMMELIFTYLIINLKKVMQRWVIFIILGEQVYHKRGENMFIAIFIGIILLIIIILIIWVIKTYNEFVTLGERVTNGKAQIAAQIESRWDAVRSLIDATKHYEKHEAETLEKVTEQRASVSKGSSIEALEKTEGELNGVIGRLMAISEAYPDLKASEVYESTMDRIDTYEDNVRKARMIYNDVVTRFNRLVRMFPSNVIASIFNFKLKDYFQVTDSKQEMPSWE